MGSTELAPRGDGFALLDVYAGGATAPVGTLPILATISAGDRGDNGYPRVSRDGRIILHDPEGRARGLGERLEAGGSKELTLALPFDDRKLVIQQRYKRYTASRLELYGDGQAIYEIRSHLEKDRHGKDVRVADGHVRHAFGSTEYAELVATCKVETRILFVLASWDREGRPVLEWPDGFGLYAIRTTSRHTLRSLVGTLDLLGQWTGGRIAGIPFHVRLTYPEVARPNGERERVPVWSFTFRPPGELKLTGRSFRDLVGGALAEAERLKLGELPPAEEETLETAQEPIPDDEDLERLARGDAAHVSYWARRFHATADGTWYETDQGRAAFLSAYTEGRTGSLSEFLRRSTNDDCEELVRELSAQVADDPRGHRYAARADLIEATATEVAAAGDALEAEPPADSVPDEAEEAALLRDEATGDAQLAINRVTGWSQQRTSEPGDPPTIDHILDEDRIRREALRDPPEVDPVWALAGRSIEALRTMAAERRGGDKPAGPPRVKAIERLLGNIGVASDRQEAFCRAVFDVPPAQLSAAQADALGAWGAGRTATDQVKAILEARVGKATLL